MGGGGTMIWRGLLLMLMVGASIYITVLLGVRRFAAISLAPASMRDDLQFWGFVYLGLGSLLFTAACTLGFYWLAKALHQSKK
jgi:hypothetical protein